MEGTEFATVQEVYAAWVRVLEAISGSEPMAGSVIVATAVCPAVDVKVKLASSEYRRFKRAWVLRRPTPKPSAVRPWPMLFETRSSRAPSRLQAEISIQPPLRRP